MAVRFPTGCCAAGVRSRSREAGVATELIATQSELTAVVSGMRRGDEPDGIRVLNGWRRELVGEELCALVRGEVAMSVDESGSLVVRRTG